MIVNSPRPSNKTLPSDPDPGPRVRGMNALSRLAVIVTQQAWNRPPSIAAVCQLDLSHKKTSDIEVTANSRTGSRVRKSDSCEGLNLYVLIVK
jgi:hypothetical protein